MNDRRISSNDIFEAILYLKQLVFEVTDACNLKCKYCAYGDIYSGYDKRQELFLDTNKGISLIKYLSDIWKSHNINSRPTLYISFYGGEPLMNMPFIMEIVSYVSSLEIPREIIFSMTTNAMLLDRYMEYLVDNKFRLLISLDGDEQSDAYRIKKDGSPSFSTVFKNIKLLQTKFPAYFSENVNINSVLHNLNTVGGIFNFINNEFGKEPTIAELTTSGVRDEKAIEFEKMYRNKQEDINEDAEVSKLKDKLFMSDPSTSELLTFLHMYSGNFFRDYNDLLIDPDTIHYCPTGTCVPFTKKMYVTVNGKIMQCEKISHKYALGRIDDDGIISLNYDEIAKSFNSHLDRMQSLCNKCYRKRSCSQCLYFIEENLNAKPICNGFMDKNSFGAYTNRCLSYLSSNPQLYNKLLTEVVID